MFANKRQCFWLTWIHNGRFLLKKRTGDNILSPQFPPLSKAVISAKSQQSLSSHLDLVNISNRGLQWNCTTLGEPVLCISSVPYEACKMPSEADIWAAPG
ncbi:Hypothetical predicted protein [Podarcis lilfordi]|uniref:Uncharacterized protein n=1 Tax=Podarcis lilfordi TaxID=74358 RepID=A0AA35JPG6_9SAUR|nr:Hypothetical predicted protein [Podarcis lilfordi]